MPLELNEYQNIAMSTAIYEDWLVYPCFKLCGETGEVLEKLGKYMRDKGGLKNLPVTLEDEENREAVALELGDVLWYISAIARDLGYKLDDIARLNIGKLAKRKEEGKLGGSGDYR